MRSDHSAATEEPALSVTPPPTSVHVIVWCGETPVVLRSLDDRFERHKCASRAWSARWPASPKGRIESEPQGPSQLRGVLGFSTHRTVPITNRHDSSWFESISFSFCLVLVMLASHFRARVDLPKKSPTANPAKSNETEPRAGLAESTLTGSQTKNRLPGLCPSWLGNGQPK